MFTSGESEWTIEAAARELGISDATAYRYFRSLAHVGLITPASRASYVLGPAIIEQLLHSQHGKEIASVGLGKNWEAFKKSMAEI